MEINLVRKVDLPTNTIASFDIGIKNLSVCILDRVDSPPYFRIYKWKIISLVSQEGKRKLKCKTEIVPKTKKAREATTRYKKCTKNASYWNPNSGVGYCGTHKPKNDDEVIRYTTCRNISDFELNQQIIRELDKMPELWERCSEVVMESQMKNNMKRVMWMIFSYLTGKTLGHPDTKLKNVKVVSASHKLALPEDLLPVDLPEGNKKTYKGRKELAKIHCPKLLEESDVYYLEFYQSHTKKDDLADSFLQGLWYLLTR